MAFPIENIPERDRLFYRVHKGFIPNGEVIHTAFQETGLGERKGMSTDWEKYSTAQDTRQRVKIRGKNPVDYAVGSFICRDLRSLSLSVEHDPIDSDQEKNRAHTQARGIPDKGELKTQMRKKMLENFTLEIPITQSTAP